MAGLEAVPCAAVIASQPKTDVVGTAGRPAVAAGAGPIARSIDFRKSQQEFLARGMASADRARKKGAYVPADKAIAGLRND